MTTPRKPAPRRQPNTARHGAAAPARKPAHAATPAPAPAADAAGRSPEDFLPQRYPLLHFPDDEWKTFCQRCEALAIPDPDSHRATVEALYSHLLGVNAWLNLTRLTEPADYLKFQLLDSLSVYETIAGMVEPGDTIADLGSGGGYPGLPLMTWLAEQNFLLVDSRHKKVEFLNASIPLIPRKAKAVAVAARGRDIGRVRPDLAHHAAIVTARAVGRGADLLPDAAELLATGGVFVLLKGPSWPSEEAPEFEAACPKNGFQMAEDIVLQLTPEDPPHHIILAVKVGRAPRKRR